VRKNNDADAAGCKKPPLLHDVPVWKYDTVNVDPIMALLFDTTALLASAAGASGAYFLPALCLPRDARPNP
jgi:hypothetical protein